MSENPTGNIEPHASMTTTNPTNSSTGSQPGQSHIQIIQPPIIPQPAQTVYPQHLPTNMGAHQQQYYSVSQPQMQVSAASGSGVLGDQLRNSLGHVPMDASGLGVSVVRHFQDQSFPYNALQMLPNIYRYQHPRTHPQPSFYPEAYTPNLPNTVQHQSPFSLILPTEAIGPLQWMSETIFHLNELRILGTNNSGFYMGESRSQRLDVSEQLKCGVRFLDLALVQYYDEIYLDQYKPMCELDCPYISLSEVLWGIRLFLERYRKEILFINLRYNKPKPSNKIDEEIDKEIDQVLLELQFDVIKKFIFNIDDIDMTSNSAELVTQTKKNIIIFSSNESCFDFLRNAKLSLKESQLDTHILNVQISSSLKTIWQRPKRNVSSKDPSELRFTWFVIDGIGYENDADELFTAWNSVLYSGIMPSFSFFTLCKVDKNTWKKFSPLMLSYFTFSK